MLVEILAGLHASIYIPPFLWLASGNQLTTQLSPKYDDISFSDTTQTCLLGDRADGSSIHNDGWTGQQLFS